jgi:hypothetical protein
MISDFKNYTSLLTNNKSLYYKHLDLINIGKGSIIMTINSARSQQNLGQNTQLHPKDDQNIAFHHTFEVFLPSNSKQVYIMHNDRVICKIPIKAFWNSSSCQDHTYYTMNTVDMENSIVNGVPIAHREYILKSPYLTSYLLPENNYFPSYNVISKIVSEGVDEGSRLSSFGIEGKEIPALEKNPKVLYTKEITFPFVKANKADGNGCKVLTVQENESQSSKKFDLPSVACKHDNGEIMCSQFGNSYNIAKPINSTKYYMTVEKDRSNNYKFYFSDKDGNKTNDLKLSLSDIRVKKDTLLQQLELNHNLEKLHTKVQTVDTHLKNGTDSFEKGTAKTINSHLQGNAVKEDLANSLSQNTQFMQNVRDNAGPSPSAVAHELVTNKKSALVQAVIDANDGIALSHLAGDPNLQTRVAERLVGPKAEQLGKAVLGIKDGNKSKLAVELASDNILKTGMKDLLKDDPDFKAAIKGATGISGISPALDKVATELLKPSNADTLVQKLLLKGIMDEGDTTGTPKTLAIKVKEKLQDDQEFKNSIRGADGTSPTPDSVATELLKKPTELAKAVLDADKSDPQRGFAQHVKDLVKTDIERDIGDLKTVKENIEKYEQQSRKSEKWIEGYEQKSKDSETRISNVERQVQGEESKIVQFAKESKEAAELSKNHANESESHAQRSKIAADQSVEYATRSETAAIESENQARKSFAEAERSKGDAIRSETAADKAEEHSTASRLSSEDAATFAKNAKDASCRVDREQQGCSTRTRRETFWEESENSEDQALQYENIFSLTDLNSVSII